MKNTYNRENLQKGSSLIITLVVVVLVILLLSSFGVTFSEVITAVKGFFGN